jgi:hypothetical protein
MFKKPASLAGFIFLRTSRLWNWKPLKYTTSRYFPKNYLKSIDNQDLNRIFAPVLLRQHKV